MKTRPWNNMKADKLLASISHSGVDHLVITGDISHNAQKEDFELMRNLLIEYDLLRPDKLSMVIGNHDIFGGLHLADEIISFPQKCASVNYQNQVNVFYDYFRESFENTVKPLHNSCFPYFKPVGNNLLIGINSIAPYSKYKNLMASNGDIHLSEYEAIKNMLSSNEFKHMTKIVLIHHHFMSRLYSYYHPENRLWKYIENRCMKLYGRTKLIKLLSKHDIKMVFHGHVHDNREYIYKGVRFLNAGGSIDGQPGKICINYFAIDSKGRIDTKIEKLLESRPALVENLYSEDFLPQLAG
jgi:3',5'-cyclic AMP phosphodiesterase CpdA